MNMTAQAHAKINLHLAVGPLRSDGYHHLQSLFARLELADVITVDIEEGPFSVVVEGLGGVCEPGTDTMSRAARLWHEASGWDGRLTVSIEKNIPVQSGLGGGSSDAASLLSLLNTIKPLPEDRLHQIATRVGSDVPFFLFGGNAAIVEGRGERVTPIASRPLGVLLVMPRDFAVSTAEAYAHLDRLRAHETPRFIDPARLVDIYNKSCPMWVDSLYNDFYPTVAELPLYQRLNALGDGLEGYATISGSGACWYIVSEDDSCIREAEKSVQDHVGDRVVCWQSRLL